MRGEGEKAWKDLGWDFPIEAGTSISNSKDANFLDSRGALALHERSDNGGW